MGNSNKKDDNYKIQWWVWLLLILLIVLVLGFVIFMMIGKSGPQYLRIATSPGGGHAYFEDM